MRAHKKSRRLALAGLAAALIVGVNASLAVEPYQYRAVDDLAFSPVLAVETASPHSPRPTLRSMLIQDPQVFGPERPRSATRPGKIAQTTPKQESKSNPSVIPPVTTRRASGKATWYCLRGRSSCHYKYPDRPGVLDMYAAAGGEIRSKGWRGRRVAVCNKDNCIRVKLVDWCACGGANAIDLYADAFRQLVDPSWYPGKRYASGSKKGKLIPDPLGRGRVSVRVLWN